MNSHKLANFEITYTIEDTLRSASTLPVELTCSSGNEPIEIKCGDQVIHIAKSQAFDVLQIIERFREFIFEEERQQRQELERQKYEMQLNSTQEHVTCVPLGMTASQILGQRAYGSAYPTVPAPYDFPDK